MTYGAVGQTPQDVAGVPGQVAYTEHFPLSDPALANAGVVNVVTDGGVDNTGATDAACALRTLLQSATYHSNVQYGAAFPWQDKILYFPNGRYLLSDASCLPIYRNYTDGTPAYGMVLVGESQDGVVLQLGANTLPVLSFIGSTLTNSRDVTGVTNTTGLHFGELVYGPGIRPGTTVASVSGTTVTLSARPTVASTNATFTTLTPILMTQSILQSGQQFGNQAFHNVIENMTLDLATNSGNVGATALSYLANNMGAVRNVTLLGPTCSSATQGTGIDMTRSQIGPALIENVLVKGFLKGIDVANLEYGITLEHITLDNQVAGAIFNTDNLITGNLLWVKNGQSSTAVSNATASGMVILANSRFDQNSGSLISNTGGAVTLYNTSFTAAQTNLGNASGTVHGKLVGSTWTPGSNLQLPLNYDTPVQPYDPVSQWAAVTSGASAWWTDNVTTPVDATTGINAALACRNNATSTMYLPHGVYYISAPIQVPSYINRIVGFDSTIRILPGSSANFPAGTPLFRVVSDSPGSCPYSPTLIIERLAFDNTVNGVANLFAVETAVPATGYTARTLVLRDIYSMSIPRLNQVRNSGEVYIENATGSAMTVNGPNWVMARQYNSEAPKFGAARIVNNGAPLWVLGLKTEGPNPVVQSVPGTGISASNEVIGGYFFTAPGSSSVVSSTTCSSANLVPGNSTRTPAAFIFGSRTQNEVSFIEEAIPTGSQTTATQTYPFYYWSNGACQAGAGATTSPYTGAIQRLPTVLEPTEAGFVVPQIVTNNP